MKNLFIYVLIIVYTMIFQNALAYTIKGKVEYTVENARHDAFLNVPYKIDVSQYELYFKDPNIKRNCNFDKNKKSKYKGYYITYFDDREYAVCYKNMPMISFYYDNGNLVYIEKYDRIRYPQKAFKYDMSGNLVSVCLYISGAEQYVFRTNGEFVGHWKDDNYYNEKGELIYTRK